MSQSQIPEKDRQELMRGWLSFYFFVALGVGLLGCLILFYKNWTTIEMMQWQKVDYVLIFAINVWMIVIVWRAFWNKSPHAVSAARTLHIAMLIDSLCGIYLCIAYNSFVNINKPIAQLFGASVWLVYLSRSKQVKSYIPTEIRVWRKKEKLLLALFVIVEAANLMYVHRHWVESVQVGTSAAIERQLEQYDQQCPIQIDSVTVLDKTFLVDSLIVYSYRITSVSLRGTERGEIDWLYGKQYQSLRRYLAMMEDPEMIQTFDLYFNSGYTVTYQYADRDWQFLFRVDIYPSDYRKLRALGDVYRAKTDSLQWVIDMRDDELPLPYFSDCQLIKVWHDMISNSIVYDIELPDMELEDAKKYLTQEYMDQFVHDRLSSLRNDYLFDFADLYEKNIRFLFHLPTQPDFVSVTLPYGTYQADTTATEP